MNNSFQYIFGPVESWRLGRSLGIDPISTSAKVCNMDCIYCQLGRTVQLNYERKVLVPTVAVLEELRHIPLNFIDYITFAGRGEPTLALNLGEMIHEIKAIRPEKVAVLTNSSLMHVKEVREELMQADYVLAKLDAGQQRLFEAVDQGKILDLEDIIQGLIEFRAQFKGKLALQVMLIEENIRNAPQIAAVSRLINAHEVQLDTPLRPSGAKPLGRQRIQWAKKFFEDMPVVTVFDSPLKESMPMDERATISRHGNYRKTHCPN